MKHKPGSAYAEASISTPRWISLSTSSAPSVSAYSGTSSLRVGCLCSLRWGGGSVLGLQAQRHARRGRRLEWHLGVRCLGAPWRREAGSLSFNLTLVSCGVGTWSVPPSRTKVAASSPTAVLYLQVSTSELDRNVWKTGPFSSGSRGPSVQPSLLL